MGNKKLTVAVIHGIGTQLSAKTFDNGLVKELKTRLKRLGKNPNQVAFRKIYWADILNAAQERYLNDAERAHDLDWIPARAFMVKVLGDASAYRRITPKGHPSDAVYTQIHNRVAKALQELSDQAEDPERTPLIVMAHSLGGHIMSNYIWDMQQGEPVGGKQNKSGLEQLETLAGFITFGCNIPLFTFSLPAVKPIRYKGNNLTPAERRKVQWLNYYDPDDILGYPLSPISKAYERAGIHDIPINVGNILTNWNPGSHTQYWTDNDMTVPAAKYVAKFL